MKLPARERFDVQLLQSSTVDLAPRVKTLARRIIRSRELNYNAVAVADSRDAAQSAHGQTPARCASARGVAQTYRALSVDRRVRFKDLEIFCTRMVRGGSEMGSSCPHEGSKRPIL